MTTGTPSLPGSEQRRLDRVLAPAYVEGLAERPTDEVAAMKAECTELETEISFVRRLAQGRIDILEAERHRRETGGSLDDLVGNLAKILADDGPRPAPAQAHLPQLLTPSPDITWSRGLEPLIGDASLVRLPDLSDTEVADVRRQLGELETEVSGVRRRLHAVLRALEVELAGRIQAARP
ncbi:MAG: aerial mycelium formation protein [Acidimicrobiia bacterium]